MDYHSYCCLTTPITHMLSAASFSVDCLFADFLLFSVCTSHGVVKVLGRVSFRGKEMQEVCHKISLRESVVH